MKTITNQVMMKKKLIKKRVIQLLLSAKEDWTTKRTKELCEKLWIGLVTTMTTNYVKKGVKISKEVLNLGSKGGF